MKITEKGDWTTYEGMRWELEDEFPHLAGLLDLCGEPQELQTPDDWCSLEIFSGRHTNEIGSSELDETGFSELDDILEEGLR